MTNRPHASWRVLAAAVTAAGLVAVSTSAQDAAAPRTEWGEPDLRGFWTIRTMTPLERPPGFEDKPVVTGDEAGLLVEALRQGTAQALDAILSADYEQGHGGAADGTARYGLLDGRTSLVVAPPSGKIPRTAYGKKRVEEYVARLFEPPAGPEDRTLSERCIMLGRGPLPVNPAHGVRLFQTPDHVVVYSELYHDAVIVPLDGRPARSPAIRQWLGDSRGYWEQDTLVVETTNFNPRWTFEGSGPNLRLVQRFSRVDPTTLAYSYTMIDADAFESPWTAEFPLTYTDEPPLEYACHEGNRSMPLMLSGARAEERRNQGR